MKTPQRKLEMTPPNSGNARHRTDYTDDDDGICEKSEKGREGIEACIILGKIHEEFQLW